MRGFGRLGRKMRDQAGEPVVCTWSSDRNLALMVWIADLWDYGVGFWTEALVVFLREILSYASSMIGSMASRVSVEDIRDM